MRVLLVSEGSGGHLIPAFEVAAALAARHVQVLLVYAHRPQTSALMQELLQDAARLRIQMCAVAVPRPPSASLRTLWRGLQALRVWRVVWGRLRAFRP